MPPKYLLPLGLTAGLLVAVSSFAQNAAPAADSAAAPAPAAASAAGSGRRGGRAAGAAGSNASAGSPAAWDRPADGPAIVSEDFESGAIDNKKWVVAATNGTSVTVESDMVAHGKNALKVHYPGGTSGGITFIGLTVPDALREHFYGRAYVYMQSIPNGHCVLMTGGSKGYPISNFLEIGMRQRQFQPSFQQNGPDVPRYEDHPLQGNPPAGRWFCLEWEYNDKPDRIVMWIDGKLAVNQTFSSQDHSKKEDLTGGFYEFYLGFRSWGAQPTDVDIYYDDIAIGDKPIGQLAPVPAPAAAAKPATSA